MKSIKEQQQEAEAMMAQYTRCGTKQATVPVWTCLLCDYTYDDPVTAYEHSKAHHAFRALAVGQRKAWTHTEYGAEPHQSYVSVFHSTRQGVIVQLDEPKLRALMEREEGQREWVNVMSLRDE